VSTAVLIGLLVVLVAVLFWQQHRTRLRAEREREERRARTNEMLARALAGEERPERSTAGGQMADTLPAPSADAIRLEDGSAAAGQPVDIDILLGDEPTSVAEQARRELGRSTTLLSGLSGESTLTRAPSGPPPAALSLLDGRLDVSLDALVLAWFSARGYVVAPAPDFALPIRLLLTHREDVDRSYAFYFERGRLHAQRAATLLDKARALGMNRLLVAAEHGADPGVSSARLRDVLVMDWVALDREMKKIDFRVAAKLIAIARSRPGHLGLS